MYVIGTAGHVDHGKSTLIEALTGIDPDRLAEEKAREMTIDLGFAWLKLDKDEDEIGVIDVPGHRDFIENMLAGVGGIDLALLVVAADEGVMPQTQEHLAILNLLQVKSGVVALTKVDLVQEEDWLELVMLELEETLEGTVLKGASIIPVSAKTGAGLPELRQTLSQKLADTPQKQDNGRPRLAVDRVFSLTGFGTVVTGTLTNGRFRLGDSIEIQPSGKTGRIRGLQTHNTKRQEAQPGSRVAINLTGVDRNEVRRGDVIAAPNAISHTILLDAEYRHLEDALKPLKHNAEVKLFVGAAEVIARARVLGIEQIEPGQTGWLQLALNEPLAVARGDRFILRRPSPAATIGGGRVLDPHPGRRHRRFKDDVLTRLKTLSQGTPADLLLQTIRRLEPINQNKLQKQSGLETAVFQTTVQALLDNNDAVRLGKQLISHAGWQRLADNFDDLLTAFHHERPLRLGMSREELRSRLRVSPAIFGPFIDQLVRDEKLVQNGALVHVQGHEVRFSAEQETAVSRLLAQFERTGINSPSVKEAKAKVGDDLYFALVDLGKLRPISADVVYDVGTYEGLVAQVKAYLTQNGNINAAQMRDLLGTSRKYAIALLEHLDEQKITRRVGDERQLF